MTPIFKNVLIDCTDKNVIGKHMFDYNQARTSSRSKPARKLIGSYFGEKILIYTPLLKWYLSHGMEITKTYCFVKATMLALSVRELCISMTSSCSFVDSVQSPIVLMPLL
ncbi:unnamed protein product [Phytophthora lilii]|uniref:Unnamed protein product n=1 Tax=Phytophthora lilii TaxID=2077276 RepID=A0A9W7CTC8_9STRA|nr:unnamed protein product [Phytophthora lilii]